MSAGILLGLPGCSSDDTGAAANTTAKPATTVARSDADSPDSGVVKVTAVDYEFKDLPSEVTAGTRFELTNAAPGELHELVAFKLPDDERRSVDELLKLPEAEIGKLMGSMAPATVILAPPGGRQVNAVGDGTLTEKGRYMVICTIPTGADPGEYLQAAAKSNGGPPSVPGGPPHMVHGMFSELTVN